MSEMVKVLDPKTDQITMMPKEELAPGMMQVQVEGVGLAWMDSTYIKTGSTFRHEPFGEDVRQQIMALKAALDEVLPKPFEQWEGEFRRDSDPDHEIAMWQRIAATYQKCTLGKSLSPQKRQDYLNFILNCSMSPRSTVLEVVKLQAISREEASAAINFFFDGW